MAAFLTRVKSLFQHLMERPSTVDLKKYTEVLTSIEWREERVAKLTDAELTEAAGELREKALGGLDAHGMVELCALGREAARRGLDQRPYDMQLVGAMELLHGRVVEMGTGEGKTLAGALAAAGYALQGRAVHVMSVNDYLARRDAEWMAPVYELLGVSVGWVDQESTPGERRIAYGKDVTYGAVSEIGFDVLRDRLCTDVEDLVHREPDVALIDEADSVLVDEARVPLVMAGSTEDSQGDPEVAAIVRTLRPGRDYERDEDNRNAWLTSRGAKVVEKALGDIDLYSGDHSDRLAAVNAALHAHALLQRDVDYIVRDGKVHLINTSRGRIALLQRWPDGLQAAVEAKERLDPTESGEVLDSISVQGLVGRYQRVCGMTGTATAVSEQLREFYDLKVSVIPPNKPCVRVDEPDRIYDTVEAKETALVAEIVEQHESGRPILVGTLDVAESERISEKLTEAGVTTVVLNAKNDAEEAAIVADAGAHAAVTVSTQMAGRGTDIKLGGADGDEDDHDKVADLGGLFVIASGHYSSSRLDNQLRGRSGRQGDPGRSVVFASLGDDLIAQYAPDATAGADPAEDGRLEDQTSKRYLEHAQRVAEGVHLDIHRNTWRYTRLIEHQRGLVLAYRDDVLRTDLAAEQLKEQCPDRWEKLAEDVPEEVLTTAARQILLFHLDQRWSRHLAFLSDVRETIHLRALARETPIDEFHRAAIGEFKGILKEIRESAVETFEEAEITADGVDLAAAGLRRPTSTWTYLVHDNPFDSDAEQALQRVRAAIRNVKAGKG
ncbi:protein translocase subunit secA [Actinokineospora alba]|uniref:Protein translocase subunit SecA n=1 Tax=Actinokineospora alba TaxID=504798 RepID=A0A1H0VWP4_9PSEU|nr:accessory Sec system translocase SecA2 [Actinokineospora alba]TDP67143.1 preprotein translocase subunit SecA [Actinokineospora alba]SDJ45835.1 preprotein translocase subunit SecA [Actinokineospora alba]SDP82890.1 protein translocase subunit secA [Actinokineospora alba]